MPDRIADKFLARHTRLTQQGGGEFRKILAAAQFGIQLVVIDDVVAMFAAPARPQVRRAINMADSQACEVGHDLRGMPESKSAVQLQTVGRARNYS